MTNETFSHLPEDLPLHDNDLVLGEASLLELRTALLRSRRRRIAAAVAVLLGTAAGFLTATIAGIFPL